MRSTRALAAFIMTAAISLTACTSVGASSETAAASATKSRNGKVPTFSDPTRITNPYLPFAQRGRWIYEGTHEGDTYLIEVTTTHRTRTIEWNGNSTEAMVVRHRGWVKGVLIEEAYDYYAQGDDGGVWYFGEAVDNYKDGELADHDGSWLAGVDGALPALLMPGDPQVGQVFYSEDVADLDIVERDEILSLTRRAQAPGGPVDNGLLLGATQPDGTREKKIFVPGVGEVLARSKEGTVRLVRRLADDAESAAAVSFSAPTVVDNRYFGVGGVDYRLYLGTDEGESLRIETAPTGGTKWITWAGGNTEAVVSQFIASSKRDLLEIAVDWFAQDDSGGVWYLGEKVWNFENGRVANTDGSWTAGRDGPPGLIMPGDPSPGQRFNPENIPGSVFETVDVRGLDATYRLPTGRVLKGVLRLHETLDDGTEETKLYAPGYGNVSEDVRGVEHTDIVYALPNDSIAGPPPREITAMLSGLRSIGVQGDGRIDRLRRALRTFAAHEDDVPPVLLALADKQMVALSRALARGRGTIARMAALDLEQTTLDIARLYRTRRPVDLYVLDLLARRMRAAADAGNLSEAGSAAAIARAVSQRGGAGLPGAAIQAARAAAVAAEKGDLGGIGRASTALRIALTRGE